MASKHKSKSKLSLQQRAAIIQRELDRGQFKQALKEAKAAYRDEPTLEFRTLLDRARLGRVRELIRQDLRPQAQDIVRELLAQDVADSTVRSELPGVLASLGMLSATERLIDQSADPESRMRLLSVAADAAIVHSTPDSSLPAEIRSDVKSVQQALQFFEANQEAEGLAALKDLPRQSPLADWKLFLRGWSAFRRREFDDAKANWQRLTAGRLPARAASLLERLQMERAPDVGDSPAMTIALGDLVRESPGGVFASALGRMQAEIGRDEWSSALSTLRQCKDELRRIDPTTATRVTTLLYYGVIRQQSYELTDRFTHSADPLPIDPRWNRLHALAAENAGSDEEAFDYWHNYLVDLRTDEVKLKPDERRLSQALVWVHMGRHHVRSFDDSDSSDPWDDPDDDELELEYEQEQAIACFGAGQKIAPELLEAYEAEVDAYDEWDMDEQAARASHRLLEQFPEHFPSLERLAEYYRDKDDPLEAREFIRRAHRLKPLDKSVSRTAARIHQEAARHYALLNEFDRGRAELAAAERFFEPADDLTRYYLRCGLLELKAEDRSAADTWFNRATRSGVKLDPATKLALAIEARRFELAEDVVSQYRREWNEAVAKGKLSSPEIAGVCDTMASYLAWSVEYPEQDQDIDLVFGCLRQATRKKFTAKEIRSVCSMFQGLGVDDEDEMFRQWVRKGRKAYPKDAFFAFISAELEFQRGPFNCDCRLARDLYTQALQAAEKSQDEVDRALIIPIQERLSVLETAPPPFSPRFGGMPGFDDNMGFAGFAETIRRMSEQLGMSPEEMINQFAEETGTFLPGAKRKRSK